jgi:ribonuclease G
MRRGRDRDRTPASTRIEDLLKEGQEVVVQVVKEPLGTKGARITSHISLPGRFLVYMPTVDHIGVSRKIESREERRRVRGIVQKFKEDTGLPGGVIIRTAAVNRPEEDILSDLQYFQTVWTEVQRRRETQRPPAVLYREESLVAKLLRDFLTEQFTAIRIDDETEYQRVVTLVGRIMPNMAARVKKYDKDYPIFV